MIRHIQSICSKISLILFLLCGALIFSIEPLTAQELDEQPLNDPILSLRSDVGIVGLTANLDWWNSFTYLGTDTLRFGTNHEVEIVFRDVRMLSPRLGVGFKILGSFFIDGSDFGLGGWGIGPVIRGYPLKPIALCPTFKRKPFLAVV